MKRVEADRWIARARAASTLEELDVVTRAMVDELPGAKVVEALREAAKSISNSTELPDWLARTSDGADAYTSIEAAIDEANAALNLDEMERYAEPSCLRDVLRWLGSSPDRRHQTTWGAYGERGGYVTNGWGLLVVDDAPGLARSDRWTAEEAVTEIERVSQATLLTNSLEIERLRGLPSEGHGNVWVGATLLDADLVRDWVAVPHSHSGGPIEVRWSPPGQVAPVLFLGRGWRALVMPMNSVFEDAPCLRIGDEP